MVHLMLEVSCDLHFWIRQDVCGVSDIVPQHRNVKNIAQSGHCRQQRQPICDLADPFEKFKRFNVFGAQLVFLEKMHHSLYGGGL